MSIGLLGFCVCGQLPLCVVQVRQFFLPEGNLGDTQSNDTYTAAPTSCSIVLYVWTASSSVYRGRGGEPELRLCLAQPWPLPVRRVR